MADIQWATLVIGLGAGIVSGVAASAITAVAGNKNASRERSHAAQREQRAEKRVVYTDLLRLLSYADAEVKSAALHHQATELPDETVRELFTAWASCELLAPASVWQDMAQYASAVQIWMNAVSPGSPPAMRSKLLATALETLTPQAMSERRRGFIDAASADLRGYGDDD
jgi:hypothetical protein